MASACTVVTAPYGLLEPAATLPDTAGDHAPGRLRSFAAVSAGAVVASDGVVKRVIARLERVRQHVTAEPARA
jgi:hypothetical protein